MVAMKVTNQVVTERILAGRAIMDPLAEETHSSRSLPVSRVRRPRLVFFRGFETALSSTTSVVHSVWEVPPALCSKGHMHSHGGSGGSGAAGVLTLSEVGVLSLS